MIKRGKHSRLTLQPVAVYLRTVVFDEYMGETQGIDINSVKD